MVRLSNLRHRGFHRSEQAVFPDPKSADRDPSVDQHHRRRVLRPADWGDHPEPFRRQARAQVDADPDARQHGYRDGGCRAAANLRQHRRRGADPSGRLSVGAGHCRRRRVGRRGADGDGVCASAQARLLRQHGAVRLSARLGARHGVVLCLGLSQRSAIPGMGLANTVCRQLDTGDYRSLHQAADSGDAGLQGSFCAKARSWLFRSWIPSSTIPRTSS